MTLKTSSNISKPNEYQLRAALGVGMAILAVVETQPVSTPREPMTLLDTPVPVQTRRKVVAQSPVGAYLYAFLDTKKESTATTSGSDKTKEEQQTKQSEIETRTDSALEDTEEEQPDDAVDVFGSDTETPEPVKDQTNKRELKRHRTNAFGETDELLLDLLGPASKRTERQDADLSGRITIAALNNGIPNEEQESQIPRNVNLFPVAEEANRTTASAPNTLGSHEGVSPLKGISLGEFVVDQTGTRQIDATVGGTTPITKEKTSNPKPKRLTKKQREALERAGVTPPLKMVRRNQNIGEHALPDVNPSPEKRIPHRENLNPENQAVQKKKNASPKPKRVRKPNSKKKMTTKTSLVC